MELTNAQKAFSDLYGEAGWELEWKYPIDDKHQHCFWHGGEYAEATGSYGGHDWKIVYGSYGDVVGTLSDEDGKELAKINDTKNKGDRKAIEEYIHTDREFGQVFHGKKTLVLDKINHDSMTICMDGKIVAKDVDRIMDNIFSDILMPDELTSYLKNTYLDGNEGTENASDKN